MYNVVTLSEFGFGKQKYVQTLNFDKETNSKYFWKSKFHASEASEASEAPEALNKRNNYYIFLLSKVKLKHHSKKDKWSV